MSPRRSAATAPKLSREALVDAAMDLADRQGLEAVTIRRLAAELGVTPMALYWHVSDKEGLMEALGERMFSEVELPAVSDEPWSDQLTATLAAVLEALKRHPSVAPLALATVLGTESGLQVAERVLELLLELGLSEREVGDLGAYLLSCLMTLVTAQPGAHSALDEDERERQLEVKRSRLALVPADRFPAVAQLRAVLLDCDDEDAYYRRGLDLLVSGLEGLVARG